ncbi:Zn-dependent exopeptidase [Plenodomus tracheiphilus IPT5]|uniref:Peptide hydrolase n=1 Tax=Plenodomus tracheiphilus IPT5 TaxID=1408161 RepID=A0A6A7BDP8_9PLEO|nr:Zn-dependent exopeptidase [Plenodomus tracheiphilus IPT5]
MKVTLALAALAAAATAIPLELSERQNGQNDKPCKKKPAVTSAALEKDITIKKLVRGAQQLQDFAYSYPARNRIMGGAAHQDTVNWLKKELESTSYYDVTLQPFSNYVMLNGTINAFTIAGKAVNSTIFEYSNSTAGLVTAPLVVVSNLGCEASDYSADVAGKIALISRGSCEFGLKSALAGGAGAAGAIIYNNAPGSVNGGLGPPPRPEGPYVATVSLPQADGLALVSQIQGGATVEATLDVLTDVQVITTNNVLATTKCGDKSNQLALGAHTDSVGAGPGINDDGSGTVGILNVAKSLAKYNVKNAVTFGFWSGEESGLLGSTYFVESLSPAEALKIRAYLNFDMIASPNFVHQIYDGDGSAYGLSGPAGSAQIESFFEGYFERKNVPSNATEFNGRSDYGPFLDANIPAGGTTTGADEIKTEAEQAIWGGVAGEILDQNYHQAADTVENLDQDAWLLHSQGIAAAVAKYATSWEGFPTRSPVGNTTAKRSVSEVRRGVTGGKRSIKLL